MLQKIVGWLGLATFIALAVGLPLLLLGVPRSYIWPVALAAAGVLLLFRPGGTPERFFTWLVAHALIFSAWCIGGVLLAVFLRLLNGHIERSEAFAIVIACGFYGVYRTLRDAGRRAKQGDSEA